MKFKYHKSYRGFYLLENEKFKRPYQKLAQEETIKKLGKKIDFKKDEIIVIPDEYVIFFEKEQNNIIKANIKEKNKKIKKEIDFEKLELKYQIPNLLIKNIYDVIKINSLNAAQELLSVLNVIENINASDSLFFSKVRKIFYYNQGELNSILNRYNFENIKIEGLRKEIELDYPSQFLSELPIDYKEYEMIFVFYFIILVELVAILK
ncbi:hypothetical protein [Gemella cuniculi]|uniref:hypothetical protein n=1 Tax=Gemella cuniculi TaxID=150240 RepID=UPI000484FC9E|nr:hypothetical protein [Gemella cuniculi]